MEAGGILQDLKTFLSARPAMGHGLWTSLVMEVKSILQDLKTFLSARPAMDHGLWTSLVMEVRSILQDLKVFLSARPAMDHGPWTMDYRPLPTFCLNHFVIIAKTEGENDSSS
jgi:hypothetical protein